MLLCPIMLSHVRLSHWGLTLGFTLLNDIQSFCAEDSHFHSCLHNKFTELHAHWFSNYTPFLQNKMIKRVSTEKIASQQFYFTVKVWTYLFLFYIFSCKLEAHCISRLKRKKSLGQYIIVHWVCGYSVFHSWLNMVSVTLGKLICIKFEVCDTLLCEMSFRPGDSIAPAEEKILKKKIIQ